MTGRRWVGRRVDKTARRSDGTANRPARPVRTLWRAAGVPQERRRSAPALRDLLPDPCLWDMEGAAAVVASCAKTARRSPFSQTMTWTAAASAAAAIWRGYALWGARATLYIPDRIDEGYGPNDAAMSSWRINTT